MNLIFPALLLFDLHIFMVICVISAIRSRMLLMSLVMIAILLGVTYLFSWVVGMILNAEAVGAALNMPILDGSWDSLIKSFSQFDSVYRHLT